jgi:hypothetical protein
MPVEPLIAAIVFAGIFLGGGAMHAMVRPRTAISIGAGASTAYVFVHMLPELSEAGEAFVAATAHRDLPLPELRIYGAALAGFLLFYGLENLVTWSRESARGRGEERQAPRPVVLLHIGGFAAYVALVGYLMVRGVTDRPVPLALYAVAMGLHFLGVDHALRREHGTAYDRGGRFVLAAAALAGWAIGAVTELSRPAVITGLGIVSGGVVMNSMIMELPGEKDGRFWPFLAGAMSYAALLALVR